MLESFLNKMSAKRLSILMDDGLPWTAIFKAILAEATPDERGRMFLFKELKRHFDVQMETLSLIGGWSYFENGGYNDDILNARLEGKLQLLDITNPST